MKTLQEQQTEAWRLAPSDTLAIAQSSNGMWKGICYRPKTESFLTEIFGLLDAEINGWDWRDTLQSSKEFEKMNYGECKHGNNLASCRQCNTNHKEDFVPEVGQKVEYFLDDGLMTAWVEAKIVGFDGPTTVVAVDGEGYFGSADYSLFRPIKTQAEKRREKSIAELEFHLEQSCWTAEQAKILYDLGYIIPRELTTEVVEDLWEPYHAGSVTPRKFAESVAAYVTRSGDYE